MNKNKNKSQILWDICSWAYKNAVGHSISHSKMFEDVLKSFNFSLGSILINTTLVLSKNPNPLTLKEQNGVFLHNNVKSFTNFASSFVASGPAKEMCGIGFFDNSK